MWWRPALRSAPAIRCWSASAGFRLISPPSFRDGALAPDPESRDSGFVLGTPRMTTTSSPQMLREKPEAARPGDIGAGLVVARALVTVKAVLRAGINIDLDLRPLGLDGPDIGLRNARILFAEMQLR